MTPRVFYQLGCDLYSNCCFDLCYILIKINLNIYVIKYYVYSNDKNLLFHYLGFSYAKLFFRNAECESCKLMLFNRIQLFIMCGLHTYNL